MNWEEIKRIIKTGDEASINALIHSRELWTTDNRTLVNMAAALHKAHFNNQVMLLTNQILAKQPAIETKLKVNIYHLQAESMSDLGNSDEAVKLYGEILLLEESDIAHVNRGLLYWEKHNYELALQDYSIATELNQGNEVAFRGAGEMLMKLERPDEAIPLLRRAIALKNDYAAAYTALGVAYYNVEEWSRSYKCLQKAVSLDPDDSVAQLGIKKIEKMFDLDK